MSEKKVAAGLKDLKAGPYKTVEIEGRPSRAHGVEVDPEISLRIVHIPPKTRVVVHKKL